MKLTVVFLSWLLLVVAHVTQPWASNPEPMERLRPGWSSANAAPVDAVALPLQQNLALESPASESESRPLNRER